MNKLHKPIVIANWKMNFGIKQSLQFLKTFIPLAHNVQNIEIAIAPSYPALYSVGEYIKKTRIKLGAQNVSKEKLGAYTGEVSALMLSELSVAFVIVGHSERRRLFHETDELVQSKIGTILKENLIPVLCVGETWEEKKKKKTVDTIRKQLQRGLRGIKNKKIVVAYEPVWAIGTGKTATLKEIIPVHQYIRQYVGNASRIIYGGSVTSRNAKELAVVSEIQGFLVGSESLNPRTFAEILKSFM